MQSTSDVEIIAEYRYEPLIAEDAVRVLVLEPAEHFESPLRCSITQHRGYSQSRSTGGCEYSAVSYTWGDCELSHQLFVRSDAQKWSCLHITASVNSFLRHFRVPHNARQLWIDAICLNQKDETEKTQQIPLMGRIYNDAKRVRIWLGDDEVDKAQDAFAIIRDTGRDNERKLSEGELQCLAELFNRPWFTRRWVIQEVVFSHDAVFHCGIHTLSLSRVMAALGQIKATGDHDSVGYGARMLLSSIGSRHLTKKGLLSLLWDFHESECGDPRDRIAAVYALATDGARPLLQYGSRNWKEIYMDVACYFIDNTTISGIIKNAAASQIVLLHLCNFGSVESKTDADCPSWIPDWSKRRKNSLPYFLDQPSLYSCRSTYAYLEMQYSDWFTTIAGHMKTQVIGQRLRLEYHPLIFVQQCGIADRIIQSSTGPKLWHEIVAAYEKPTAPQHRGTMTYYADRDSLIQLLAQILVKRDEAAGKASRDLSPYEEEISNELHAHRDGFDALSEPLKMDLQHINSSLRHSSIMRIQAIGGPYWAIGPPNSEFGDWVVPVLLSEPSQFILMICLRPISSNKAESREPPHVSHVSDLVERCLRFFSGNIEAVNCLHMNVKFVGPASHCYEIYFVPGELERMNMVDIIYHANKMASGKGLPGPIVFDVV